MSLCLYFVRKEMWLYTQYVWMWPSMLRCPWMRFYLDAFENSREKEPRDNWASDYLFRKKVKMAEWSCCAFVVCRVVSLFVSRLRFATHYSKISREYPVLCSYFLLYFCEKICRLSWVNRRFLCIIYLINAIYRPRHTCIHCESGEILSSRTLFTDVVIAFSIYFLLRIEKFIIIENRELFLSQISFFLF